MRSHAGSNIKKGLLSSGVLLALEAHFAVGYAATPYLSTLNNTVHGRLHINAPFSLPCFSSYNGKAVTPDAAACAAVQKNYTVAVARANSPGAYMNNQDEMCASDPANQCLLDSTNPSDPLAYVNKTCSQGNVPPYYIEVTCPSDVQAALRYASRTNTPLSIKNSGHDYLARSGQKGALALWMRNLRDLNYEEDFVPEGCSGQANMYQAITAGAGVNMAEVYSFANEKNVTIIGGYAPTIALGGGYVMGAGHSVLSPVYGLGIDRVLQFKVVTPDGVYRTANACQNRDLFWALRGGGGGTFGVVMETTHRVEPPVSFVAVAIQFKSNSTNLIPFYEICVNSTLKWASEGWGGHISGATMINITPLLTLQEAEASMATVVTYAKAQGGSATFTVYDSWYPFYEKYVVSNAVAVGNTHIVGSQLVPRSVFADATSSALLMDYLSTLITAGISPYVPVVAPVLYNYTANSTSATPAWREAVWELGSGATWAWNSTLEERQAAVTALNALQEKFADVTGGNAYMNEASPFTTNWREAWWGENYAPLLAIKNKYDPEGLLSCWKCVGWNEAQAKNSCLSALV